MDAQNPMDFSKPRKKIEFRIDGDLFEAAPVMPAQTLMEFAGKFDRVHESPGSHLDAMRQLLEMVLLPVSYQRLLERMSSRHEPVDINQISDIIVWLLEAYGLRPTRPSSSYADGPVSPGSGISSTEITPDGESMSSPSRQTVS